MNARACQFSTDARPRVAERLTVGRTQRWIDGDGERPRRRLRIEAGVLEREVLALVELDLARRGRRGFGFETGTGWPASVTSAARTAAA